MPMRWYRIFQALILLALFFFLGSKVVSNQLSWYIHPRFTALTLLGMLFLGVLVYRLVLAMKGSFAPEHEEYDQTVPPVNILIMLTALLVGILIPARPLGSATVSTKGPIASVPMISSPADNQERLVTEENRNIVGWVMLFAVEENLDPYMGEEASVTGFVYHDQRLPEGRFFVSRIVLSCCAADGFALSMMVDWPYAASLKQDTWVYITGPVDQAYFADDPLPVPLIRASRVEIVPQPEDPYLFP